MLLLNPTNQFAIKYPSNSWKLQIVLLQRTTTLYNQLSYTQLSVYRHFDLILNYSRKAAETAVKRLLLQNRHNLPSSDFLFGNDISSAFEAVTQTISYLILLYIMQLDRGRVDNSRSDFVKTTSSTFEAVTQRSQLFPNPSHSNLIFRLFPDFP